MKTYTEYKDSGVPWIGAIPSRWNVTKVKYVFSIKKAKLPLIMFEEKKENTCVYLTMDYIRGKKENIIYAYDGDYCDRDDLLLLWDGSNAGELIYLHEAGFASSTMAILKLLQDCDKRYSSYYMQLLELRLREKTIGMGVPHVDGDFLRNLEFILPQLTTQKSIADYLDPKTSAIDSLIEDKQKMIEFLKEKRLSIISEVVTKGLDKTEKMKDSRVEWIGYIPEKWEISKVKYISSKIGSGKTPKGGNEVYVEKGILFVRSQNVYDTGLVLDEIAYITDEMDKGLTNTRLEYNDVLLNITGASIGRSCIWNIKECRANINQHVCIIRTTSKVLAKYLHSVLISFVGKTEIDLCQTGANRQGLNFEDIANFIIPIPELDVQQKIVNYIEQKTVQIDILITDITEQIEKLKEYRQAIISEAVTGKVAI